MSKARQRTADPGQREAAERSLGEKIEWLIRHRWPADAPPPRTNADIADAITAATAEDLSSTGVWKLRTGRGDNPTLKTLTALARFFGVPLGYFGEGETAELIGEELALLTLLRDKGFSREVLRSLADLSARGRTAIAEIVDVVSRLDQALDDELSSPESVHG